MLKHASALILDQSFKDELSDKQGSIREFKQKYSDCIQKEIHFGVIKFTEIQQIQILASYICDTSYNSERKCSTNTRVALLNNITDWSVNPGDHRLFWLYGIAGAGKSSVANTVASQLQEQGILGGCFFSRRDDLNLSNPKKVLPTLAYQLARVNSNYRELLIQSLNQRSLSNEMSVQDQFDILFGNIHKGHTSAKGSLQDWSKYVIVIDAIDEIGDETERSRLLQSIIELHDNPLFPSLFLTSRKETDIAGVFARQSVMDRDIMKYNTGDDIKTYIYTFLKDKGNTSFGLELSDKDVRALVEHSSGLFIWTSTVLKLLSKSFNYREDLTQILSASQNHQKNSVLYNTYITILDIASGDKSMRNRESISEILSAVLSASRVKPFTKSMLRIVFAQDHNAEKRLEIIIQRLHSVISVDSSDDTHIRVYHTSFLDFLQDKDSCGAYFRDESEICEKITQKCLEHLCKELKFNMCYLDSSFVQNKDIDDLPQRIKDSISSDLVYCSYHWVDFTARCRNIPLDHISAFIESPTILFWIEIFTLQGNIYTLLDRLRVVLLSLEQVITFYNYQYVRLTNIL
jgi:hypothetical protein